MKYSEAQIDRIIAAIRSKCLDCSGNSRKEVEQCGFTDCPLFPYRMGIRKTIKERYVSEQIEFEILERNDYK